MQFVVRILIFASGIRRSAILIPRCPRANIYLVPLDRATPDNNS